jgi:hypothetical protein
MYQWIEIMNTTSFESRQNQQKAAGEAIASIVSLRLNRAYLKHTFGGRLRAAGVSFEDRQDLLGHNA